MKRYTVYIYDETVNKNASALKGEIKLDDRLVEILLAGGKLVPVFHGFATEDGCKCRTKEHGVLMRGRVESDDEGVVTFELDQAVKATECGFPDAFLPNMGFDGLKALGLLPGSVDARGK